MLRALQRLKPGQSYRISLGMLMDVEVPANPLDRQTPEYLAEWMHARLLFYSTLYRDPFGKYFDIHRPAEWPAGEISCSPPSS